MSNSIKDMLREHADSAGTPQLDVDTMISDGGRRVRRNRLAVGAGAAAVTGVLAVGLLAVPDLLGGAQLGEPGPAATTSVFAERRVGYASGRVIHWGSDSFTTSEKVAAYVQTDDGFVYVTPQGDVRFLDGETDQVVGHSANQRLRADDDGSLAAWVDAGPEGSTEYVVLDTATVQEVARVADPATKPSLERGEFSAALYAVDEGNVIWRHGPEVVRYDVASGQETVLATWQPPADPSTKGSPVVLDVVDAADGVFAYYTDGPGWGLAVGPDLDADRTLLTQASHGVLSPDGLLLGAEEDDNIAVYNVESGDEVTPDLSRYPFAVTYGWVDNDTAMVLAITRLKDETSYPVELLACDIGTDGGCEVVSTTTVDGSFTLPVGDPMDT